MYRRESFFRFVDAYIVPWSFFQMEVQAK